MPATKPLQMQLLKDALVDTNLTSDKTGQDRYKAVLTNVVNKLDKRLITDAQRNELKDAIKNLNGDPTMYSEFLRKYTLIAGDGTDTSIDTSAEADNMVKSGNASSSATTGTPSSIPASQININIAGTATPVSLTFSKDAANKVSLDQPAETDLKAKVTTFLTMNPKSSPQGQALKQEITNQLQAAGMLKPAIDAIITSLGL